MLLHPDSNSLSLGMTWMLDHIAASVAPPMLTISSSGFRDNFRIRLGKERGMKSPERYTSRREGGSWLPVCSQWVTISSMSRGTVFQMVTFSASMSWSQCTGSGTCDSGSTTRPPALNMPNMSYTDRSKLKEERAKTASFSVTWNLELRSKIVFMAPMW